MKPNIDAALSQALSLETSGQTTAAWEIVTRLDAAGERSSLLAMLYARMSPSYESEPAALDLVLQMLEAGPDMPAPDRSSLHFAAANLLDRMGSYDKAFAHATQAHSLRQAKYDPVRTERLVRDWLIFFTPERVARLPRATHGSDTPVFIVGMPRSGTTLVEQILASHHAVHGAGELDWVFRLWGAAFGRLLVPGGSLIECLNQITVQDADELASEYLTPLRALSAGAARITDKLPMNLMNLGLISILFPQARVIYCRRDPLDTCLSCYMTDLAAGRDFNFDLTSSGHLYRYSAILMDHWKAVLELPILEIQYEQVVEDLESQARRMIDFLGLRWDKRCLLFYQNKRHVATATTAQVRQPIYRRSVGRWRHYDSHLGPLRFSLAGKPPQA